jgi:hypothetical protein
LTLAKYYISIPLSYEQRNIYVKGLGPDRCFEYWLKCAQNKVLYEYKWVSACKIHRQGNSYRELERRNQIRNRNTRLLGLRGKKSFGYSSIYVKIVVNLHISSRNSVDGFENGSWKRLPFVYDYSNWSLVILKVHIYNCFLYKMLYRLA